MLVLVRLVNIACLIISDIYKSGEEDRKHREAGTGPYSPEALAAKKLEGERKSAELADELARLKVGAEEAAAGEKASNAAFNLRKEAYSRKPIEEKSLDIERISDLEVRACVLVAQSYKSETKKRERAATLFGAAYGLRVLMGEDEESRDFPYGSYRKYNNNLYFIQQSIGKDGCRNYMEQGALIVDSGNYKQLKFDSTLEVEKQTTSNSDQLWLSNTA